MADAAVFCPHCATPNSSVSAVCSNPSCGKALPRRREQAAAALSQPGAPDGTMAALKGQVIAQRAQVKSPGVALLLAIFFPALGAAYTGKWMWAAVFFVLDIALMVIGVTMAETPPIIYRFVVAALCHKWAKDRNAAELQKLIAQHQ